MEEEEAGVEKASQLLPFLVGFPAILEDCAGVSLNTHIFRLVL